MATEIPERIKNMTEEELRDTWRQMDDGMWEFENDPDRDPNRNTADEYLYDDLSHEAWLINEELKRRGLQPCERPAGRGDEEEEESNDE